MSATLAHSSLADCAQVQTFVRIEETLHRLDQHSERTALALEEIAKQGAMVASHEKRLDKHDLDLREVYSRVNDTKELDDLKRRVIKIELKLAEESGAEEVHQEKEKFWTDVKIQLVAPAITTGCFLLWTADKLGVFTRLAALWAEFHK